MPTKIQILKMFGIAALFFPIFAEIFKRRICYRYLTYRFNLVKEFFSMR